VDPSGYVVATYGGASGPVAHYTFGLGLVFPVNGSTAGYYDFDLAGNTIGITGPAGTYANQYSYLPFGTSKTLSSGLQNPFTYVGEFGVTTDGTGLAQMGARYYLATTGQFVSNDPLGLSAGDTNVRRYVGNNPINAIDPSGLNALKDQVARADAEIRNLQRQLIQYKRMLIVAKKGKCLTPGQRVSNQRVQ
jgi:RHS repeat-associated protein